MYKDIINLPYPNRETERDFPDGVNRAAQFAPFAALTGFEDCIEETARITHREIQLDEEQKEIIDRKIRYINHRISDDIKINITYFAADKYKEGGRYVSCCVRPAKVKEFEREIVLDDGNVILIDSILSLEIPDSDI